MPVLLVDAVSLIASPILAVATALYRRAYQREASHRRRCERASLDVGKRVRSEFLQNMSHELRTPLNRTISLARCRALDWVAGAIRTPGGPDTYLPILRRAFAAA